VLVRPRDGRRVDRAGRRARARRVHSRARGRSVPDRRGLGQGQVRAGATRAQGLGVGDGAGVHAEGDGAGKMKGMERRATLRTLAFSQPGPCFALHSPSALLFFSTPLAKKQQNSVALDLHELLAVDGMAKKRGSRGGRGRNGGVSWKCRLSVLSLGSCVVCRLGALSA